MPKAKKERAPRKPRAKKEPKTSSRSILDFTPPGYTLREGQRHTLKQIEENWNKADVFLIDAPVAAGKSLISVTIARWLYGALGIKSTIAVPNNLLRTQYTDEFKFLATLEAQAKYTCIDYEDSKQPLSCKKVKQYSEFGKFCDARACCYLQAVRKANAMPTGVYNYHTLLAYQMFREVTIFDEAHNVINVLRDAAGKKIWRFQYGYPENTRTFGQLYTWVSQHPDLQTDRKLGLLLEELESGENRFLVERTTEDYRGEERDLIKLSPLDVSNHPPMLWPEKKTKKLILMSATMNIRDLMDIGLDKRRVMTISTPSPIPVERRPLVIMNDFNLSYRNQERDLPRAAAWIEEFMKNNPERGFIHAPYGLARRLAGLMSNERLIFHETYSRQSAFDHYKETEGAVLVASGMAEGVSLADDLGRWQIILKVPWPSLAEPAIKWKAENDPDFYLNTTVKDISQMYGRICRSETDFGKTIFLDNSFRTLYKRGEKFFPSWLKEAIDE